MFNQEDAFTCADVVRTRLPGFQPKAALILGSGLGALAEVMTETVTLDYAELPGFPVSGVAGHAGQLVAGKLEGVPVLCMKGRGHFYEGRGMQVMTTAVRTFKLLGCEFLLATNAAGSLRRSVAPGSLVAITDHINFMPESPLVGANDERFDRVSSAWRTPTIAICAPNWRRWPKARASRWRKGYSPPTPGRISKRRRRSA